MKFAIAFLIVCADALAAGGSCPSGANYLNATTGALVTLSSLGVTSCYYVSSGGVDTASGTSESTPWLHAPGMANCSNNCASASVNGGVGIILRGGDSWHFSGRGTPVGLPWGITGMVGSAGSPNYFGVDPTWSGGSWARPVMQGDNAHSTSGVSSCAHQDTSWYAQVEADEHYVIVDNFEWDGMCWGGYQNLPSYLTVQSYGGAADHIIIENQYFHGWTHVTFSSCNAGVSGNCDGGTGVTGGSNQTEAVGDQFVANVVDGSDSDPTSFDAWYGDCYDIHSSVFRYASNGVICNDMHTFHDNLIEHIAESTDGQTHSNGFEFNSEYPATNTIYNNLIRHTTAAVTCWVNPAQVDYDWNNVVYDTVGQGWDIDTTGGGTAMYFYNNTIEGGGVGCTAGSYCPGGNWEGILNNNVFINGGVVGTPTSQTNSVVYSSDAAANTAGLSASNNYSPDSQNCNGVNSPICPVGNGNNLTSSWAVGYSTAATTSACMYHHITHSVSCPAITAISSPSSGAWDVGAYMYQASGSGGVTRAGPVIVTGPAVQH